MQNSNNISCHNTRASSAPEEHPLHNQEQRPSIVSSLGISETSNGTLLDDKWVSVTCSLLTPDSHSFLLPSSPNRNVTPMVVVLKTPMMEWKMVKSSMPYCYRIHLLFLIHHIRKFIYIYNEHLYFLKTIN